MFRVILTCADTKKMRLFYEQQLLDKVKPEYNIAVRADSPTAGTQLSDSHKAKIGAKHKGKKASAETIKKQSEAGKMRPPASDATRAKISEFQKGREHSPEHLANQHAGIIAYWANNPIRQDPAVAHANRLAGQRKRRQAKAPSPEQAHANRAAAQQARRAREGRHVGS